MAAPLEGVRVLEVTTTVAGPTVGMILGEQGADIIKVEPPGLGDMGRFMGDGRGGMSAMFATLNRNKRSVALDLKDEGEMAMFRQLAARADVFIENYRPGVPKKLGIDYASLSADNPGLIYCSITGYGSDGPYAHRRVYDPLIQATIGASAVQGTDRAQNIRCVVFDKVTGYTAAQSITAALFARERTGKGEHLEISMMGAGLFFQWPDVMWSHTFQGEGVSRSGPLADWFSVFRAKDGDLAAVIMVADHFFQCCCEILEINLHLDERFASFGARLQNRALMHELVDEAMGKWTVDDLVVALDAVDVPVARVNELEQVFEDPQVVSQNAIVEVEHPVSGTMKVARWPVGMDEQGVGRPAPVLGEHNAEVLGELGVDGGEIERMEARDAQNRELLAGFRLDQAS